ncbi:DUF1254 domain-containing protein [Mesorhizobium sp. DCY119]|uniref:DUF1254 domain-containing protein n=1 Tax=Mesorhizobium sp. DCY119 TaxID=2108445 RepID=UPI000E75464A|nr:DUF1254 domain-containing protein [Mesorhizobium sp. DCY119]RJG41405.1 DUF1254 domain-containing protein [Mesorhizobium sp. DCY119]
MVRAALAILGMIFASGIAQAKDLSADELHQRILEGRAVEAVIWGMPAVNALLMYDQMVKAGGKVGQIIYWGKPLDRRNQTLTPNPDTLYSMGFYDTKADGPMVIEIPPAGEDGSLNGNFVTLWQEPLEDAGLLGVDKGAGVKFLVTPPGYSDKIPDGFEQLASDTYNGYFLVRSNLKSHADADVQKSIAYAKRVKFYPLSALANPPKTVFLDVKDKDFDSTIKYDLSFFTLLDRVIQSEPWIGRDRVMIDLLRSLGIEKGKPFQPDAKTKKALQAGIANARDWLAARYDAGPPPFFSGTHWTFPTLPELMTAASAGFNDPDTYPVDARGLTYTYGYIGIKRLGAGQFYLINIKDKNGKSYDGGKSYHLHVPPNVPVAQYWSVTAYDRETHALIKGVDRASRASNAVELEKNSDGSVDIWLGSKAPKGKKANWIPTDPKRRFELMFRLYGPSKDFFDKKWILPDVEKVAAQ